MVLIILNEYNSFKIMTILNEWLLLFMMCFPVTKIQQNDVKLSFKTKLTKIKIVVNLHFCQNLSSSRSYQCNAKFSNPLAFMTLDLNCILVILMEIA